jgi:hypothetical protein
VADSKPEVYIAEIKSNTEKLSDRALHDTLVNFVRNEALMGEVALKAIVPKGDTLALTRAAGHKGPYDEGAEITAYVGIPEIHKAGETDPLSAKYPLFVEKGTGIFGDSHSEILPKTREFMKLPTKGDYGIFHKHVKGQEGRGFMLVTFSVMVGMLRVNGDAFRVELTSRLKSDKLV